MNQPVLSPVKTKKQIAGEYHISPRTLRRWFQKWNLDLPNRYLTPKEQAKIYETFGPPPGLAGFSEEDLPG